jgi:hypothetical protein
MSMEIMRGERLEGGAIYNLRRIEEYGYMIYFSVQNATFSAFVAS